METIHFSPIPVATDGRKFTDDAGYVVRKAKVFETGRWPDKGDFSLDESEADDAVRSFAPVPNNIEHQRSVLDGHLGTTEGLYRKGKDLFASLRIPKWLDEAVGKEPIRLSAEWTREPKRMTGMAMVLNPRIVTAAAHAFSEDPSFTAFAATHPEEAREIVTEASKAPNPATPMNPQQIKEAAWTSFSADPKNAGVTREQFDVAFATQPPQATTKPEPTEADRRIAALEAQIAAQFKKDADREDAEDAKSFYAEALALGKASPATRSLVEAAFSGKRALDRVSGDAITFSKDAEGSQEASLRKEMKESWPVVFRPGKNVLESTVDLPVPAAFSQDGLGPFSDDDFRKPEEAK